MVSVNMRVVRAFYYDRKLQKKGTELDLPKGFAAEVVASGKAEYVSAAAASTAAPETAKDAGIQAKTAKG